MITPKQRGNIINSYNDNKDRTFIIPITNRYWTSLAITNDGLSDLTLTINNISVIVKAGETFDDDFEDFTQVQVTSSVDYRICMRG